MSEETTAEQPVAETPAETARIVRHGWNPPASGAWALLTGRNVRRVLIPCCGLALLAWFAWLVWAPLRHPRVQFVCLSGGDYRVLRAEPIAFVAEDIAGLAEHGSLFTEGSEQTEPYIWDSLAEPAKFQTLGARLNGIIDDARDQVVLVVSAHGLIDGSDAYLACRNFDPANPKAGRVSAADLVKQLRACRAGKKILILDIGRIPDDPRMGYVWNDFAARFAAEIQASGDESLWLLVANGVGEQSHVSSAIERSVFGSALQWGLTGAADADDDQRVTLLELHRYVSASVSDWVQYVSSGTEQQHPLLAWGGEGVEDGETKLDKVADAAKAAALKLENAAAFEKAAADVVLAPVSPDYASEAMPTLAEQVQRARATSRGEAWYLALNSDNEAKRANGTATPTSGTAAAAAKDAAASSLKRLDFRNVRSAGQLRSQAESGAREASREASRVAADQAVEAQTQKAAAKATAPEATAPAVANESAASPAAPATPAPTATTEAPAGTPTASGNAAAARTALPKLFAEAWRLRDALAALPPELRPADYAPHAWREMERALLDYELQYRAGRVGDSRRITGGLNRMIAGQRRLLAAITDATIGPAATGPTQMLRFRPSTAARMQGAHSAAMAKLMETRSGRAADPALASVMQSMDQAATDQAGFRSAWTTVPSAAQQYSEVRGASTFGNVQSINWTAGRLAWQTERIAETLAAAAPWLTPWVAAEFDAADSLRWEGERELLDAIGADHATRAQRLLEQSLARYQIIATHIELVGHARQLERELLARAPEYLRLQASIPNRGRVAPPSHELFISLCEQLEQLSELLITPDPARIEDLRDVTLKLGELRAKLEEPISADPLAELTSPPPQLGEPARIAAILFTPLPSAESRMRLLSIASRLEGRLISDLKPVRATDYNPPLYDPVADAYRAVNAAQLHWALTRLSTLDQVDGRQDKANVNTAFMELQSAAAIVSPLERETVTAFERQLDAYQTALSVFHGALPRRIADAAQANQQLAEPSTRAERLIALRRVERALRILDPRDARQSGDVAVCALIDAAEWQSLIAWHADRATRAAGQAFSGDAERWNSIAADYQLQAAAIFGDSDSESAKPSTLVLDGDDTIDLSIEPNQSLALTLRNLGASPADVWLSLKFDPETVAIEPSGQYIWNTEHDVIGATAERDAQLMAGTPSLRINPGQEIALRLQARSLSRAAQPARVIARALTRDSVARHAMSLNLPSSDTVELAIDGVPGTATRQPDGWLLTSFPNRDNAYQWSLANSGESTKEVKAELFALTRPWSGSAPQGSLSAAEATELRDRLGPLELLKSVDKIALPSGGVSTPLPFPAPDPAAPAPPADQPPPPPPRFDNGLLLSITDASDGRVSLHWIQSSPQRPRRFVRPRVRYNGIDERIEITVTAQEAAGMPEQPVRVACETLEPLPTGTQARLSDELRAPDYRAQLWIEAPLDPARVVTLAISVDGYPRAFLFRVPCQESGSDLAPVDDVLAIRVKAPATDAAFHAPASAINVLAEIDVPRGAEDDDATQIELGFDTDRDREFRGESTTRISGDRQVRNQLLQLAPTGQVVVHPRVTDFELALTPPGLINNRVGVMGRILWGDRAAWSEPREIILDGAAPRIERVRVKPAGVAAIGSPVEVTCLALDGDLAGVESVEMTIDLLGAAGFEGNPPPTPAILGADRRWKAQLDTAPIGTGTYHVLVRATDKVGNVSEVDSSASVRLLSPETIAAELRRATNRVSGAVQYGRSGFGGVMVRLEALPPDPAAPLIPVGATPLEPIAPVATDDQGSFLFDRVPPGKYKLTAEGVVRNKTRRAEAEVTVEPAPTAVRPLQLELR
ncbi:MAG: hypothetical protein SGJ19_18280 [Planctomycetia bacterium]|nr:hypothetical protein [Planctomycetia bacterium]